MDRGSDLSIPTNTRFGFEFNLGLGLGTISQLVVYLVLSTMHDTIFLHKSLLVSVLPVIKAQCRMIWMPDASCCSACLLLFRYKITNNTARVVIPLSVPSIAPRHLDTHTFALFYLSCVIGLDSQYAQSRSTHTPNPIPRVRKSKIINFRSARPSFGR
jgi:hypothetical protein